MHVPFIVAAELALPDVDFASKTNGTSKTNESRASSAATKTSQKPDNFDRRFIFGIIFNSFAAVSSFIATALPG